MQILLPHQLRIRRRARSVLACAKRQVANDAFQLLLSHFPRFGRTLRLAAIRAESWSGRLLGGRACLRAHRGLPSLASRGAVRRGRRRQREAHAGVLAAEADGGRGEVEAAQRQFRRAVLVTLCGHGVRHGIMQWQTELVLKPLQVLQFNACSMPHVRLRVVTWGAQTRWGSAVSPSMRVAAAREALLAMTCLQQSGEAVSGAAVVMEGLLRVASRAH
mmetsp:Transcript_107738/g.343884  ORF Transcript_107738/g.343884 Transcript_107738/m.343884 type:complete len:218 (-) Transcript_107738:1034-1687(-)